MEENEKRNIVYLNDPDNGVWTSKTTLIRHGVGAFPPPFTKVNRDGMFLKKGVWYITLEDAPNPGEIILVGEFKKEYLVRSKTAFSKRNYLGYQIERCDGERITSFDVNNAKPKTSVKILGRKTVREHLKITNEL